MGPLRSVPAVVALAVVSLGALSLAGCGSSGGTCTPCSSSATCQSGESCESGCCVQSCAFDRDCESPLVCRSNRCVQPPRDGGTQSDGGRADGGRADGGRADGGSSDGGLVLLDGGSPSVAVGSACQSDPQCGADGICITELPGGYCTVDCSNVDCPAGSDCFEVGEGVGACFQTCQNDAECRQSEGYVCDADNTCYADPVESDGGVTPADGGVVIVPDGGVVVPDGGVVVPDGGAGGNRPVGSACTSDGQCAGGSDAYCDNFAPGGYCTFDCTIADCPLGSECFEIDEFGSGACFQSCTDASQCRASEGYICDADNVCFEGTAPPVDGGTTPADGGTTPADGGTTPADGGAGGTNRPVGAACTEDAQCTGSAAARWCITELPAGYCTVVCTGTGVCPAGSTCFTIDAAGNGICFDDCATSSECRQSEGYYCDADDTCWVPPATDGGTTPADGGTTPADGGTTPADGGALREVGAACTADGQCAGGTCFTDAFYPGGYCTKSGCSTSNPCPSGSACFPLGGGSSACFKTCTSASQCRQSEGYTCDLDMTCYPQ